MSLRPRTESEAYSSRQQPVSSSGGGKGKLSMGKSNKVERSKSSRRTGKRDKTSRRHKRETIDDNQSEISYQPDTDLSKSKASKKIVAGKQVHLQQPFSTCIPLEEAASSFAFLSLSVHVVPFGFEGWPWRRVCSTLCAQFRVCDHMVQLLGPYQALMDNLTITGRYSY